MTGGIKIVSEQNLGSYVTLQPINTTNTFTPTTLKTIEQMFVDVEEPETYKNQAGFAPPTLKHKTYINMDSSNWQQGGVLVKAEPDLQQSTVRHLTHAEAMEEQQAVTVTTTVRVAQKPKRPSSLLVGNGSNSLSSLNIPIETPTNVMNQLDFNALMDGRTGLTPTNILTPIMVNMTTSPSSSSSSGLLQTPTVSTSSCGSQQRTNRSAVLQELGSPNTGGHLVSL